MRHKDRLRSILLNGDFSYAFILWDVFGLLFALILRIASFSIDQSTDPADKEPWKDKGTGQLFIKREEGASKGTKESKPRILVRNDVCFLYFPFCSQSLKVYCLYVFWVKLPIYSI